DDVAESPMGVGLSISAAKRGVEVQCCLKMVACRCGVAEDPCSAAEPASGVCLNGGIAGGDTDLQRRPVEVLSVAVVINLVKTTRSYDTDRRDGWAVVAPAEGDKVVALGRDPR